MKNDIYRLFINVRGFTLIELLVVVGVLGILVSVVVVIVNPQEQFRRANDGIRKNDLNKLQSSLELFRGDNNAYPQTLSELSSGSPTYIQEIPTDPNGSAYSYTSQPSGCDNEFTLCSGYSLFTCLETYDKDADVNRNPPSSNQCSNPLESYTVTNP